MNFLREAFDSFYDTIQPIVFSRTNHDPEKAHELFIWFCRILYKTKLEKLVLDNDTNKSNPSFEISDAAGFNKNGDIPPSVLHYLGFDRAVIGTVTADYWKGNPRPRCVRFPKTESMVNWQGLPGIGAEAVAEKLATYSHTIPLTINFMATPKKKGR